MFGIGRRHAAVAATPKTWWTDGPPNTWQLGTKAGGKQNKLLDFDPKQNSNKRQLSLTGMATSKFMCSL
jgi:hypothetical protein